MSAELVAGAVTDLSPTREERRVRRPCPMCELDTGKVDRKRSLSFETSNGWWKCHKCGSKGTLPDWGDPQLEEMGGIVEARPEVGLVRVEEIPLPEGYAPLWARETASSVVARPALEYARRRVPEALWRPLGIGATLEGRQPIVGRVIVPVLDMEGRCVGWVGRAWGKATKPYLNAYGMERARGVLWNPQALVVETDAPLIVVEGVFDAIHLWPDAVALLGKPSLAQMQALAMCSRPVVWGLDGDTCDEQGVGETDRLFMRLSMDRCQGDRRTGALRLPPTLDPDQIPAAELKGQARACLEERA